MDKFITKLNEIDKKQVISFLRTRTSPCYESELYKIAFPQSRIFQENTLSLYQNHFLLFHLLYRLQSEFLEEHKYLHIHFMRIFLTDYPKEGFCRYYHEETHRFCGTPEKEGTGYCSFHSAKVGETEIEELSARYFYLDSKNYYELDETSAEAFINGAWEMLKQYKNLKESYKILDLPETADRRMIKKKFRSLAKKYHPDKGYTSHEKFNEINRAYRLLDQATTFL